VRRPGVARVRRDCHRDTPLDVACAAASGARSIAVATGEYDVAALRAAGADVVFEDLSDTQAVLRAL
jgi:phosphoglycolate phosphatase-like HAD superfamily hydrolase